MKKFYKIVDSGAHRGSGFSVPDGFIEYEENNIPLELQEVINKEALDRLIADGEALVTAYIQAEVDKFNDLNGTKFADIHAMANYKDSVIYPHATACKARWDWNEAVWMKARSAQAQAVVDGLSPDEFLALLPKFV